MSTAIPDLWPSQLEVLREPSPVAILRQQAYLLGQKTGNRVMGEVVTESNKPARPDGGFVKLGVPPPPPLPGERRGTFTHTFWMMAPLLDFREKLLVVKHGLDPFYPAEVAVTLPLSSGGAPSGFQATGFAEFTDRLRAILSAPDVVNVISSLSSQSRDEEVVAE